MRRCFIAALPAILIFSLAFYLACSDSDKGTNTDSEELFLIMRDSVESHAAYMLGSIIFGYNQFEGFEPPLEAPRFGKLSRVLAPLDTTYYEYENGWHIFVLDTTIDESGEHMELLIADSIQFKDGDQIVETPGDSADFMDFRFVLDLLVDTDSADLDMRYEIDNEFQKLECGNVEVNGTMSLALEMDVQDEGSGVMTYDITVDELVLDGDDGCPLSGVLQADLTVDFACEDGEVDGDWTMIITFIDGDTWTIRLENGDDYWQATEQFDCSDFDDDPLSE